MFPCFLYKQKINKLHRSLFNFLALVLGIISSPSLAGDFCVHVSGNPLEFHRCCVFYHSNSNLPKIQACFLQEELYPSPLIKSKFQMAAICWPRSLCLSLSPAASKNQWQSIRSRESKRGCIACAE